MIVRRYGLVDSTNTVARHLLDEFPDEISVVLAEEQTSGRGRMGRSWFGKNGSGVFCSAAFHPTKFFDYPNTPLLLQAWGAMCVRDILLELTPTMEIRLKYPNDVLIREVSQMAGETGPPFKKIAGVVVESEFEGSQLSACVVGIGINVGTVDFPDDISFKSTSLGNLGYHVERGLVEELLVNSIQELPRIVPASVLSDWRNSLSLEGKELTNKRSGELFLVVQVLDDGRLDLRNVKSGESSIADNGDSFVYDLG